MSKSYYSIIPEFNPKSVLKHWGLKGMKWYEHQYGEWQKQAQYANGMPDPDGKRINSKSFNKSVGRDLNRWHLNPVQKNRMRNDYKAWHEADAKWRASTTPGPKSDRARDFHKWRKSGDKQLAKALVKAEKKAMRWSEKDNQRIMKKYGVSNIEATMAVNKWYRKHINVN